MTLHTSSCRRVVHRQLLSRSPNDSIWISDQLLAAAFDRYCRISKAGHRNVGHVPGPLEGQRRLGKRRMGDMYFQQASSAPLWAFPVSLNLSQWQWEAPKPASELQNGSKPGLWARVIEWLETTAYPELHDPDEIVLDPATTLAAEALANLRNELDAFLSIPQNESLAILELAARDFFAKFEDAIRLGTIPVESILSTFQETWQALDNIYVRRASSLELYFDLCSRLVTGISMSRVREPGEFHTSFWAAVVTKVTNLGTCEGFYGLLDRIMVQISRLPFDSTVADLWLQIMNCIPAKSIPAVHNGIISMIDAIILKWSFSAPHDSFFIVPMSSLLSPDHPEPKTGLNDPFEIEDFATVTATMDQIRTIASAMRHITTSEHLTLLDKAYERVKYTRVSTRHKKNIRFRRYNWACVLAHMPGVSQYHLFKYIANLSSKRLTVWSDHQLCCLVLFHWESRGCLRTFKGIYERYDHWYGRTDGGHAALMCYAMAVFVKTPYPYKKILLASLGLLLKMLGRHERLFTSIKTGILSLANPSSRDVPVTFLQQVACAVKDRNIAMKLHDLFTHMKSKNPNSARESWDPRVFRHYVSDIIQDETISPGKLWSSLDMVMYENIRRPHRTPEETQQLKIQHLGIYGRWRAEIATMAACEFAKAPHLSDRTAFRHLEQCIHFLERSCDVLPVETVDALYKVVSRDLKNGNKGRLSRLRWFIDVIRRNYGREVAERTRAALFKWREEVKFDELLREREKRRMPKQMQMHAEADLKARQKRETEMESLPEPEVDPIEEALKAAFNFK